MAPVGDALLEAQGIQVHYGGVRAVDSVDLRVNPGEHVGLVGPNGSGKTTFLNALCGTAPAQGRLWVDGRAVPLVKPLRSRTAGILRVFQAPQTFTSLTCLENVLLATSDRRVLGLTGSWLLRPQMWRHERARWERALAALEQVGLADHASESAGLLSYGQQRLLELARALSAEPRLLLLDEPSAGLNDSETADLAALLERLAAAGSTYLLVDHKIDFVDRVCDRVVVLELGNVIADGPASEVWKDGRVIDAYLGAAANA